MITSPTTGSAQSQPTATPPAPSRSDTGRGWASRVNAAEAASTEEAAMIRTITTPARSSARPYP